MGFLQIRHQAIAAILEGRIQYESRGDVDEKNLLLTGAVTPEQVVRLLKACRGTQYTSAPHHLVRDLDVHMFKPEASLAPGGPRQRWYIKLYFIEPDVWFISVHVSAKEVRP
jgi:hypothetical protein